MRAHAWKAPKNPVQPQDLPVIRGTWPVGTITQYGVAGGADLAQKSMWTGVVKGNDVGVRAGSTDTVQFGFSAVGKIVVQSSPPDFSTTSFTSYADPSFPGPWIITSAKGNVLTLVASNGKAFTFNANIDSFGS